MKIGLSFQKVLLFYMIITLINQKGGVGKTTSAYLIACALKEAGVSVVIEDLDPQKSLTNAVKRTGELQTLEENPSADHIIQDLPGHLNLDDPSNMNLVKGAIAASDRIIIPSELSIMSVETSVLTAIVTKKYIKKGAKSYVLFSKVRASTTLGKQDQSTLASTIGMKALKNFLPLSSSYELAPHIGYVQALSSNSKCRRIVEQLALEILS